MQDQTKRPKKTPMGCPTGVLILKMTDNQGAGNGLGESDSDAK